MFITPARLENDLVLLEALQEIDFERLYDIAKDPGIWELHPESNRYERDVFLRFFDSAVASKAAYLIFDKANGELVGSTRFHDYDGDASQVGVGYTFLARKYWGGKYNKACKVLMIDTAFQHVDKVVFYIGAKNFRSQRGTEKIGAKRTRPVTIDPDAKPDDKYEYTIVKDDWNV